MKAKKTEMGINNESARSQSPEKEWTSLKERRKGKRVFTWEQLTEGRGREVSRKGRLVDDGQGGREKKKSIQRNWDAPKVRSTLREEE